MNDRILSLLYRSFDAKLSEEDERQLNEALKSSSELRDEKKRMEAMRRAIYEDAERTFNPFFSARVMRGIDSGRLVQDEFFESLVWIFRRIALAGGLAMALFVTNSLLSTGRLSFDSLIGMPKVTLEDTYELDTLIVEERR